MLAIDAMHTVDGGVTSHVLGNLFFELVYEELPGRPKHSVGTLWREINKQYNENGKIEHRLSFHCCCSSATLGWILCKRRALLFYWVQRGVQKFLGGGLNSRA